MKRQQNNNNKPNDDDNLRGRKPKDDDNLRGRKQVKTAELYVQNVHRNDGDSLKDIADRLKRYCHNKEVRVVYARVYQNRYYDDLVGVKIAVPASQADQVLGNRIWPDDVTCRWWRRAPPERDERDARPQRHADDAGAPQAARADNRNENDYWWHSEDREYGGKYGDNHYGY